jgi:hypothetical protein
MKDNGNLYKKGENNFHKHIINLLRPIVSQTWKTYIPWKHQNNTYSINCVNVT